MAWNIHLPMDVHYSIQAGLTLGIGLVTYFEWTAKRNPKEQEMLENVVHCNMNASAENNSRTTSNDDGNVLEYNLNDDGGRDVKYDDGMSVGKKLDCVVYLVLFSALIYVLQKDYEKSGGPNSNVLLRLLIKAFPRECRTLGISVDGVGN